MGTRQPAGGFTSAKVRRTCGGPLTYSPASRQRSTKELDAHRRHARLLQAALASRSSRWALTDAAVKPEPGGPSRTRVIGARVLTVVAILLALIGMVAFYVAHTALDKDGFETVSRNLIENDLIRTQVANTAVDKLYENVDVEAAIAARLPPAQRGLAPALAGISRSGAYRAADAALERPRVQKVWVAATTATQRQLVALLDDKTKFVQTEGGNVVLDLRPIMIELGNQVVVLGKVAEKLPESSGKVTIIKQSQLESAQTITRFLRAVADWMWLVAIAVAALAIWLARGRRRLEVRALALGVLLVGLLMLAVRRFAGGFLVDRLAKDDTAKPAVQDTWNILTQVLSDRAWVWIILGIVTLVGVWFVGDTRRATQARRAAQPVLQSRPTTYAVVAVALLVLVLIAPALSRSWVQTLILIVLVIGGVEVVRNIVQREAGAVSG
jgi:hypothetical protein